MPNDDPQDTDPAAQAQQRIADLEAQIEAAATRETAALDATRAALRAANPHLPHTVFAAEDVATLTANVEAHTATLTHAAEYAKDHPPAAPPGAPPSNPTPPGAGNTRQPTVPDNVRGVSRIQFALNNPGQGMTE